MQIGTSLQIQYRYYRITRAEFYSFALLRIPVIKNDEIYRSACAITTREDYTVLKTIRHSLKLAALDLRRDLDPYRRFL